MVSLTFFTLSLDFAIQSSWSEPQSASCLVFYWWYRAFPSLTTNNIINLISVLTIWWCPCVVISWVVGKGCLLRPVCSLDNTLLAFSLLHFALQGQTCLLLSWQSPMMKRTSFFGASSRRWCCHKNWAIWAFLASVVRGQIWITVMLNALPWKQTEI